MATRILPLHGADFSRDDGITLAVQLLRELEDTDQQESCFLFDSATDKPRPDAQHNIVEAYLQAIAATGSTELQRGFSAVLSDYLACAVGGMVVNPDLYDPLVAAA